MFTPVTPDPRDQHQAEEQFRIALESSPTGMIMVDAGGTIVLVNQQAEVIFGYHREELLGNTVEMLIPQRFAKGHPANQRLFHLNPIARRMGSGRDLYGLRSDGLEVPLEIALNPVNTSQGFHVLCSVADITERKRLEDERNAMLSQLRSLNDELRSNLAEREVLLQEVHHRVKNNLQVISSLINMQARKLTDATAHSALMECKTRVEAISLIHEKLYQSSDYAAVPFATYARTLLSNIVDAVGTSDTHLIIEIEDILLSVAKAIPCGLVLNELVTNAIKHAFKQGMEGEIRVSLDRLPTGMAQLEVTDNGIGMDPTAARPNSLGLHLVETLVRQLDGELDVHTGDGTRFRVTFPLHEEEEPL